MSVQSSPIQAGLVYLPEDAFWLMEAEREWSTFPNSATKDQTDALSQGLKHWRDGYGDFWDSMEKAMKN